MSVRYTTSLDPLVQYDASQEPTVIGDENFVEMGGPELLTFNADAAGGDVFQGFPWGTASADAIGGLRSDGGFEHRVTVRGSAGGFFGIPDSVNAGMSSRILFAIDRAMDFELTLLDFDFDNDVGSGGFGFRNTVTDEEFTDFYFPGQFDPSNPLVITGTIGPGSYELSAFTNAGISEYAFTLTPTPSTAALLGLTALIHGRRRR